MNKKVLLIAPDWMGLHKDIIDGIKGLNYEVDFIAEKRYSYDPYYKLHKRRKTKSEGAFLKEIEIYWRDLLSRADYSSIYDYLLVVDGQAIHPCLFEILQNRNPNIKKINYLFDRIDGVYSFNVNFNYFDRIFTFDPTDSLKYNIQLLQIYWVPVKNNNEFLQYRLFGFGTYSKYRYDVFWKLSCIFSELPGNKYIKLYNSRVRNKYKHEMINIIRVMMGLERNINIKELNSGLITSETIPTEKFRSIIASSDVIIDTSAPYQDGITARFMWALGAGKRIITTNRTVPNYSFYSKEQIFILEPDRIYEQRKQLLSFIEGPYEMPVWVRHEIDNYRIDNWIQTLLQ